MSGLSLAVEPPQPGTAAAKGEQRQPAIMGGVMGSLRLIELQLVAFIMVFSASGLVPLVDLAFPVLTTVYVLLLSRLAFSPVAPHSHSGSEIFRGGRLFRAYMVVGTTVGLFLPLAYVLGGFARGDEHAVRSATPHLFLLSCQILTESVIAGLGLFSPPVRALVPLLYTVRRVFVIVDWIHVVWANKPLPASAPAQEVAWTWFGRVLAVANLVYFTANLLGFLIPVFLPRAFEKYFRMRDEACGKKAEDEPAVPAAAEKREAADVGGKADEAKKED